tara:strand:- start:1029 stop:2204 length:1176 start_codon:yes stop_codon:yes gene_type:complete
MVSKKLENQHIPTQCNFKQNTKKNITESRKTIDQIHSENCERFKENDRLKFHIKILEKELAQYNSIIQSERIKLEKIIESMTANWVKDDTFMVDYLLNLGKFLLKESVLQTEYDVECLSNKNKVSESVNSKINMNCQWDKILYQNGSNNKGTRHKNFLSNVCNEVNDLEHTDEQVFCMKCKCPRIIDYVNATSVCPDCGESSSFLDNTGTNYNAFVDDTIECIPVYEYKRINHLNDWMASFQGVENVVISNEIILLVNSEIKRQRLDKEKLKPADIKLILKKLRLNKYYEHIYAILSRITNRKPISLTNELQESIRMMFMKAERTFLEIENKGRTNFLSYSYLLHKFMALVGRNDLVDFFPLLKSRTKLYSQDQIWRQICKKNNWEFTPSM